VCVRVRVQGDCTGNCPPDGGDPNSPQWCPAEIDSTMQVRGDSPRSIALM